jgi:hypothetical protein
MNWDAIGAVGEIVGAMAVVVSLVYLGSQIRNQVRESRVASVHEITEAFRTAITSFQDPQRAEVYTKALTDFDQLSESQRLQFISMAQGLLRVWEEAYYQHEEGRLDERIWKAMLTQYVDIMSAHGFLRVWEIRKHAYSDEFRAFVDRQGGGEYRFK